MERRKARYNIINMAVMMVTVFLFIYEFRNFTTLFASGNVLSFLVITVTAILVHTIKVVRLYLALYGSDITFNICLKIYCRVMPVSAVIPFKMGEFFRMYCYGKQIGDVLKGAIIVLFDRFMDTVALVTVIIFMWLLYRGDMTSLVYILMFFLMFVMFVYFIFPGLFMFWKQYLLKAKASKNRLSALRILEALNCIHKEIVWVAKGRGLLLYFISLVAWSVEISSLAIVNRITGNREPGQMVFKYLSSAMTGNQLLELRQFIIVSVTVLITASVIMKVREILIRKKVGR